jgi:hypothetical protein
MLSVLDKWGPVLESEEFAERCIAIGMNATTHYIYRLISPVVCSLGRGTFCRVGAYVPPGTVEAIVARRRLSPSVSDHGWTPAGTLWFGIELTRMVITIGSIRLASFVKDLVQGEWRILLPDGNEMGTAVCKDVFITSFRKAFALLGAEPGDFACFEFDLKTRSVTLTLGGADLFETMQEDRQPFDEEDQPFVA